VAGALPATQRKAIKKEAIMGSYHRFMEGNLALPVKSLPSFLEAIPGLMEKYALRADQVEEEYQELASWYKKDPETKKEKAGAGMWNALSMPSRKALAFLSLLAQQDRWSAELHPVADPLASWAERAARVEEAVISISFDEMKNYAEPEWLSDLAPYFPEGA